MKAHANPNELHLLGQAEVQPLEEEVEASAVEEEDSKKLSEKFESGTASEDDGPEEDVPEPSPNNWA
ncbi:hypothetical protein F2Q68_00031640 [Brassica cretica]|uniref:Uncharacterized protein n=1 Tax=Brassica cretica TaxID=69181 RepID=A0A8S9G8P4_BRACR|nr:hypothetical protein F2Q68_00031640 [Brassica cretica]